MKSENKIPKIVHYCWFGDNEKPKLALKCIESWKKFLPDYEIREWNNDDLAKCQNKYVQEAFAQKKWAFISDYFRLYALYNFGGIYFDSDNEIIKNLDEFLELDFFTGYENYYNEISPFTAVVGAKKGNKIVGALLKEYDNISFINEDGSLNTKTNTARVSEYFERNYQLKPPHIGKEKVELEPNYVIFPYDYFCPQNIGNGRYNISSNTFVIHCFAGSWISEIILKKEYVIFKNLYLKIYTITKGCLLKSLKQISEIPVFAYSRFNKRTVLLTLVRKNTKENND